MLPFTVDLLSASHHVMSGIGIVAFSMSGAIAARNHRMDAIGYATLGVITAVGGGATRDLVIGATPVAAVTDLWMIALALIAAAVVFLSRGRHQRFARQLEFFDAIGLGVFVVEGSLKGLDYGLHPFAATLVGVLTGVGGGVLRDTLCRDVPIVFRCDSNLYVVPGLGGALLAVGLVGLGWGHPISYVLVAALVVAVRLASIRWDWHVAGE